MPDVLPAVARTLRTLADGTVRLQCDIEPNDAQAAMALFGQPGTGMALAALKDGYVSAELARKLPPDARSGASSGQFGQQAQSLKLSRFFRTPDVWRVTGPDSAYLAWLREQPCMNCNTPPPSEAAHVRRVSNGAGMGIKPEYSAIPLCHACHGGQHQDGEDAIGGREYVDKMRIEYLQDWCWARLKDDLGVDSMANAEPKAVFTWAKERGVERYLPGAYR